MKLEEEALDGTVCWTRFGSFYVSVEGQAAWRQ